MELISLRYADRKDLNLVKNLSWQTFFDTFNPYNTKEDMELFLKENFNEKTIVEEIAAKINTFIIASIKKQPVGYVKLSESENPNELGEASTIEISRIYALKEKVGSGVGKALMNESLKIAKEKNKEIIWLGVWEYNQRAIQFYRRFGFEKFGEHEFMVGKDKQNDWLMKKEIS